MTRKNGKNQGFSLVELVVVIVIIGILAAIAIPRLSRGASGASESAVIANLTNVRHALSIYFVEHNNKYPNGADSDAIVAQLTKYSSVTGATSDTKDSTHRFGPYLASMPGCPVGENAGSNKILVSADSPPTVVTTGGEGWVYNKTTGEFLANTQEKDGADKAFNTY